MNYKRRGRSKDQKVSTDFEKGKCLESAILVNQLQSTRISPPAEEIARSRQHFREFKKYYEGRLMNRNQISNNFPDKKPVMLRTPLRTVKTVSVEVPLFAKSAIYKPSFNRSIQRSGHPKKCDEKEEKIFNPIKDAINQTGKTKLKNSDNELKADTNPVKRRKPKIIVHKHPPVDRNKHTLVSTLTKLNQKLQNLQEKYFNEPKPKYKSIYDIDEKMKINVHTIYENTEYTPNQKSSYCFKNVENKITKTYTLKKSEGTVFQTSFHDESEPSLSTIEKNYIGKGELPSEEKVIEVNSSSVDVILSPNRKKDCRRKVSLFSVIEPMETIEPESLDGISGVPGLEESILKSDYLMKEFDVNSNRLNFDLNKIRNNVGKAAKKSVHFELDRERTYSKKQMEDSINRQLENSFFQMKLK